MKSILENLRRLSLLAFAVIAVFISYTLFPAAASATVYVGNLSYDVNQQNLEQVFSKYGSVGKIQILTDRETGISKGIAYVEMNTVADEDAAIEALDGAEWMGRDLKVNKAKPRENRGSDSGRRRY